MAEATRGFSIATRCKSVEEFVATFSERVDATSIVLNVVEPRAIGTECAFAILLADKKPVLAGTCTVLEVFKDTNNAFKRVGMRLAIKRLGPDSERMFARLTSARAATKRAPLPSRTHTMALPIVTAEIPAVAIARATTLGMPSMVVRPAAQPSPTPSPAESAVVEATPRVMTQPLRGARNMQREAIVAVPRTITKPMRSAHVEASARAVEARPTERRMPTVQIPARNEVLPRAPRATGTETPPVGSDRRKPKVPTNTPMVVLAEGSVETIAVDESTTRTTRKETRTPGSSFILPANPLMNMTDASLEGLVDCRLFESQASTALFDGLAPSDMPEPPMIGPDGTLDERLPELDAEDAITAVQAPSPELIAAIVAPAPQPIEKSIARAATPTPVPIANSVARATPSAVPVPIADDVALLFAPTAQTAIELHAPARAPEPRVLGIQQLAGPDAEMRLPAVEQSAVQRSEPPRRSNRFRLLVVALLACSALGVGVVVAMPFAGLATRAATVAELSMTAAPATLDVSVRTGASVEAPPPAPSAPVRKHLTHAVLINTSPIAARVTVAGQSFGTTPTYIKIPGNTPTEVRIERRGFKPITRVVTSKTRFDRLFVPLKPVARPRR